MKKADILDDETCETIGVKYCKDCPDYDTCDNCGRRVCNWVSVNVIDDLEKNEDLTDFEAELWCRYCCREYGFSENEIKSQKVRLI